MRLLDLILVALLVPLVADQGLPRHHHEHHPAPASAELSFPSSLGSSSFAELSFPSGSSSFAIQGQAKRLAGLGEHFLVLQPNQEVFGTGYNFHGQLGTGTYENAFTPKKMVNAVGVVDVSAGTEFSCLVIGDTTQCVGRGDSGQLGRELVASSSVLVPVSGPLEGVSNVYCGDISSFAITIGSGHVYAWGYSKNGLLGVGSIGAEIVQAVPKLVSLPSGFNATQVGAGVWHSCFLGSEGDVHCTGRSDAGRLGDGGSSSSTTPVAVDASLLSLPGTTKFVAISAGNDHTCATATDNKVYCWGSNFNSQLGSPGGNRNKPTPVAGITNARSVLTGGYNTFVIDNNPLGSGAVAFGQDKYGVFGLGSIPPGRKSSTPLVFGQNVTGIVEIRGGWKVTCILNVLDEVWCTGQQDYGQFGRGRCKTNPGTLEQWGSPVFSCQPTASPTSSQPTSAPTSSTPTQAPTSSQPTTAPTNAPSFNPTSSIPTQTPTSSKPTSSQPTTTLTKAPTSAADANAKATGAMVSAVLAAAAAVVAF